MKEDIFIRSNSTSRDFDCLRIFEDELNVWSKNLYLTIYVNIKEKTLYRNFKHEHFNPPNYYW